MKQLNLFEGLRATSKEAITLTIASLKEYGSRYNHWAIAFSGGKDSSALVTLVADLIDRGKIDPPESLTVLYADTRQELPPLQASAKQILTECDRRGFSTKIVAAELDKRMWVYILGTGVPSPSNTTLRYCTSKIKVEPMQKSLEALRKKTGEDVLFLTGVRIGESAARDNRIAMSCSRNAGECGQGWFQNIPKFPTLAPLLHWRVCHIWDWLMIDAPDIGFSTEVLAEAYGGDEVIELEARTGCIGCPLVGRDLALDNLILKYPDKWGYLAPLKRVRQWHDETRKFKNRLQKYGERNKNGQLSKNPNRKGPIILEVRLKILDGLLEIQQECNSNRPKDAPEIWLINEEEEARIRELIALKKFPQRWDGSEANGAALTHYIASDGSVTPLLPLDWESVGLEVIR